MGSDLVLILVVVAGVAFDFTNGFHDTANAMATSIATGALKAKVAVIPSACLNFAFGILLLAVARARSSQNSESVRLGSWALAGVCGAFVIGAAAIGIIAMIDKPASKAKKAHKSTAALVVPEHQSRLVA
jgi:phosphate/sulfate permease